MHVEARFEAATNAEEYLPYSSRHRMFPVKEKLMASLLTSIAVPREVARPISARVTESPVRNFLSARRVTASPSAFS